MSTARYPGKPASVPAARRFAEKALGPASGAVRDQVLLMVSELATNAVKHARSDFELAVQVDGASVWVEVRDFGGGHPTRRNPPPTEPTGRGLLIVQGMADTWGVDEHAGGKAVWFTIGGSGGRRHARRRRSPV
jgi:serine/threonine-protein kinase RsbW